MDRETEAILVFLVDQLACITNAVLWANAEAQEGKVMLDKTERDFLWEGQLKLVELGNTLRDKL